ncbi:uncharacterized protein LOC116287764 [Actinia tenebrosa]|uniref:Uncharacterized protein LOC116287764 n=1 Tax=Actinia tenebrosa TaxID=6105 RepID=A0A6P8H4F0_ACTTE|nr:uncharacterized protein LOC116287764 [Actinia tenebrosa]
MTRTYLEAVSIPLILIWMTLIDSGSAQCSCYTFDGAPLKSWSESRKLCTDNDGELVSMETLEEWEFIKTQIQSRKTDKDGYDEWWIGPEKRDGRWEWLSNHSLTYNKWQYNKPDDSNKDLIHVIMAKSYPPGTYGLFRNKKSDSRKGTICEYKGAEKCISSLKRVSWCYPTTEPPSRSTMTMTNTPSQTAKMSTTDIVGNYSPVTHHSTFATDGPVAAEDSRPSFPTAIVASVIGVLLLSICLVILACIWKQKKQERKPRKNVHLNKKSRVPVKLESSVSSNINDFIATSEVNIVSDNASQPEPAYASISDQKTVVNVTDRTNKEAVSVYASVHKNKTWPHQTTNQANQSTSHVIYAELNEAQKTVNHNSCHGNEESDSISYDNEINTMGDLTKDNRLVYAELAEFKDSSEQRQSSTKMPSPYKATEYATIMKPILCNRSESNENITAI